MRFFSFYALFFSLFFLPVEQKEGPSAFIVKPYLQIGTNPDSHSMDILWQAADEEVNWLLETRIEGSKQWTAASRPVMKLISASNIGTRRLYTVSINSLVPGKDFEYRISRNNKIVFTAVGKAPKSADQPYRLVVSGDIGAGTKDAKLLAGRAMMARPDMLLIAGDLVYERGLMSEYDANFWPVYNADSITSNGAPLMRSIPFVGSPGNHDTETRDFQTYPDALAYYLFWNQPMNGPAIKEGSSVSPALKISDAAREAFMKAAGDRFPRMSNFSFDYANAHWTVIDSNPYVDWTDSTLVKWVAEDLAAAKDATWKFVLFHHPGFTSSREHFEQQHMRLLSPVFEKAGVDVVFNGHVHNYQRSFPMQFAPDKKGTLLVGGKDNKTVRGRVVNGRWTLDKSFDGKNVTRPNGVIYIVTGSGGQELYNPEQNNDPDSWQKFTSKFISDRHSLSVVDISGKKFTLRQLTPDGTEIDSFTITK